MILEILGHGQEKDWEPLIYRVKSFNKFHQVATIDFETTCFTRCTALYALNSSWIIGSFIRGIGVSRINSLDSSNTNNYRQKVRDFSKKGNDDKWRTRREVVRSPFEKIRLSFKRMAGWISQARKSMAALNLQPFLRLFGGAQHGAPFW